MKKTLLITAAAALATFELVAGPAHFVAARPPAPRHSIHARLAPRHAPAPKPRPPAHSRSFWGKGGRYFWPGFIGGVVGTVIAPPPPGPYAKQIWIEGHYEIQVINGVYTQVWIPGKWVVVR